MSAQAEGHTLAGRLWASRWPEVAWAVWALDAFAVGAIFALPAAAARTVMLTGIAALIAGWRSRCSR